MSETRKILVLGAGGQIGTDLVDHLRANIGNDNVIASDIRPLNGGLASTGPFEIIDVLSASRLREVIDKYKINEIYHLAAMLSASGEKNPIKAWDLNINGLLNVLELARNIGGMKIFWPSSIAVFGPTTPKRNTPQKTIMEPSTVYGISKLAGERWCEYYNSMYDVDVRSLRYPGVVSYKTLAGGGTTDYAVDIFHHALDKGNYTCFLSEYSTLPMMYMPDVIKATVDLMEAPLNNVKIRSSYNVAGLSFSPSELAEEIKKHIEAFNCTYEPDFRQKIADSWPQSISDNDARNDWDWNPAYDLSAMTIDMIKNLRILKKKSPASQSQS